jgi:hypothetical protein
MSDFHAIGGVSLSLKRLLEDRMELPNLPGNPSRGPVTISTPGSETVDGDGEEQDTSTPRINLFLYRITENGSLKNQEIPGHGHPGAYGHPPLSLDLHYVLTAYGSTSSPGVSFVDETVAHYLLGSAMRVLHDHPVITKQLRTVRPPAGDQILDRRLTEEFEQVKLYLDQISLEDLSKVWTSLMLSYRLSVAYKVTVVQIESQRARHFPKLVGEPPPAGPRVYAVPYRSPHIQEVHIRRTDDPAVEHPFPYARIGDTLVIRGRNFGREPTRVLLGGLAVPATPLSDDRVEPSIPDENLPDGTVIPKERRLQPGAQPVSVVVGVPELPQTGFHSNQAVFMLVPLVGSSDPMNEPTLDPNLTVAPRTLTIRGKRLFLGGLSGETLVGSALIGKRSYMNPSSTEITVPLPDTLPARQVRCLVSGDLSSFPADLEPPLDIEVEIGNEGSHSATLTEKPNIESAAGILQAAIRDAHKDGPAFNGTRITMSDNRIVVVPGGLFHEVSIHGSVAEKLKLSTAQQAPADARAELVEGAYLSGELDPFPALTAVQPSLKVTIGSTFHTVRLASPPTTLADAADELQIAITQAAQPGEDGFSQAGVAVLESQLLILPGTPDEPTNVERVPDNDPVAPGGDQATVAELQLRARYPVRVRVNGAENISDEGLEMPEMPP